MHLFLSIVCSLACQTDVSQISPAAQSAATRPLPQQTPAADKLHNGLYKATTLASVSAEERNQAMESFRTKLAVKKNADGTLNVGGVCVDIAKRQLSFPATLNMDAGEIEYILVAKNGKLHESLFSTEVSPEHIHLAALLLGLEAKSLPEKFDDTWVAQKLAVSISWERNGGSSSAELNQLFSRSSQGKGPPGETPSAATPAKQEEARSGAWYYHGSQFFKTGFAAQIEGSILGLTRDPAALMNPDLRVSPESFFVPNAAQLPRLGSRVTFILSLPMKQ